MDTSLSAASVRPLSLPFDLDRLLVTFGNFLLKRYGVMVFSTDGKNTPLYQREVTHADYCNWKDEEKPEFNLLPSQHQIGDSVWLRLWSDDIVSEIHAVHFYEGKVKYDLKVSTHDVGETRLYNIDSAFVHKTINKL
jgi:hypothetical protein